MFPLRILDFEPCQIHKTFKDDHVDLDKCCRIECAKFKKTKKTPKKLLLLLNPLVAVLAVTPTSFSLRGDTMRRSTMVSGI